MPSIQFVREEEQDTRLIAAPADLCTGDSSRGARAAAHLLDASNYNRMALARALRRDITIAYLDWLKARSSVEIVAASEALLRENLRVNESLFGNGKITEDQVLRARPSCSKSSSKSAKSRISPRRRAASSTSCSIASCWPRSS